MQISEGGPIPWPKTAETMSASSLEDAAWLLAWSSGMKGATSGAGTDVVRSLLRDHSQLDDERPLERRARRRIPAERASSPQWSPVIEATAPTRRRRTARPGLGFLRWSATRLDP